MWESKTVEQIFKYFGYDVNKPLSDTKKAEERTLAIQRMRDSKLIPDEVITKVTAYDDDQIKQETVRKERREAERRRRLMISNTKSNNREQDVYADDEYAQAVYQHIDEEEDFEIEDKKQKIEALQPKLNKHEKSLKRLREFDGSMIRRMGEGNYKDKMYDLENKIDELQDENDELTDDIEENDIYGQLYEEEWTHYGLRSFETPNGDYAVGTEDECEEAARQSLQNLIDDNGVEGFSSWVIESNVDKTALKNDIKDSMEEYYNEEVRENLEVFFDDYDEDDEETHPSDSDIDDKVQELADDRAEDIVNDANELDAYGYDIKDYLDIEGIISDCINADGIGHTLSTYDGEEHNIQINGTWYNVYRTN